MMETPVLYTYPLAYNPFKAALVSLNGIIIVGMLPVRYLVFSPDRYLQCLDRIKLHNFYPSVVAGTCLLSTQP